MEITIRSTDMVTQMDRVPVRVWEGTTPDGVKCKVFVHRIAVSNDEDQAEFDRVLKAQLSPGRYVPLSLIL